MAFIEVKNKNNTANKTPPSGYTSWLDFWEVNKGKKATTCEALSCAGKPDVGGHVIKSGEGGKEYILPICYSCNNKPENQVYKAWESDLVSVK
ncbi:hypothetical protein [Aeromonas enteropelogenes]|uniref:hypothetical protein n=1 Tax=Aeromonas enteropelogenes TaxID=29489 RepID=UPI003BA2E56F